MKTHDLCVIIPTFNEEESIEETIIRLQKILNDNGIDAEILIIDDESTDRTIEIVERLQREQYSNIRFMVRHPPEEKDLALSIAYGFNNSTSPYICVTDGDGSHEMEKIPDMYYRASVEGYDIVLGSRYMEGGSVVGWPLSRYILSRGATFLTRLIFPYLTDPGNFFTIRRSVIDGVKLHAHGFKLSVEVIDKGKWDKLQQIPYTFTNRKKGKSKLKPTVITDFIKELIDVVKTAISTRNTSAWDEIRSSMIFTLVGAIGIVVNLSLLYLFTDIVGLFYMVSGIIATSVSLVTNFILNDRFSFKLKLKSLKVRFSTYASVTLCGIAINIASLYVLTDFFDMYYILSGFFGILIAYLWNLMMNRRVTWCKN